MIAFVSYAHQDHAHLQTLEKSLAMLKRQGLVSIWHAGRIQAGDDWQGRIDANLEKADVILLLVSADFLNSSPCWETEMKRAMELHDAGRARVIPIFLGACSWSGAPFGRLQGVPDPRVPILEARSRDVAWTQVAEKIGEVIRDMRAGPQ